MKKNFTYCCLILSFFISLLIVSATRVSAQNCPFNVRYRIIPETCPGKGGFEIYLLTDNGDTIHIDPMTDAPTDPNINLMQVQFFAYSETDSVKGPSPEIILDNPAGTWTIGVTAHCHNGTGGGDEYTPLEWKQEGLLIPGAYQYPNIFLLASDADDSYSYGHRLTLPCDSTGRIQMQITGGTFPYYIVVVDTVSGDTVRNLVFNTNQYTGWDEYSYDYRDYYTIDSLPAGIYRIHFVDGCGQENHARSLVYNLREAVIPYPTRVYFYGTRSNNGEVAFQFGGCEMSFTNGDTKAYLYDTPNSVVQYRVCYGTKDTSEWKNFPMYNFNQNGSGGLYLCTSDIYDTAKLLTNYCELEGQSLTFQYRIRTCDGQIYNFYTGELTNSYTYFYENSTQEALNYAGVYYDSISYHIPNVHYYTTQLYGYVDYNSFYMSTEPITWQRRARLLNAPTTWTLTDLSTNEIVFQEVRNTTSNNWYISKNDLEDHYGPIEDTTMYLSLRMEVSDNYGCSVSSERTVNVHDYTDTLHYYFNNHNLGYSVYRNSSCCSSPNEIVMYERLYNSGSVSGNPIPMRFKQLRDGATFRVYKSPRGNKYNFTATYHFDTDSWEVVMDSASCNAIVEPYLNESSNNYDWGLKMKEYCMPAGDYYFEYTNIVGTSSHVLDQWATRSVVSYDKPVFETEQVCDRLDLKITSGAIMRQDIGTDRNNPLQPEKVNEEYPLTTRFRFYDGPVGGYPTDVFQVGQTVSLTIPGTYYLKMFTDDYVCGQDNSFDTTITYTGGTVMFDYTKAYVCDKDSTVGFLYCQAKDGTGTPPFTYTLYKEEDGEGVLLGTNTSGIFRNIPNVHYGDHMSVQVQDDCDRKLIKNFYVSDFSSNDLAWFDGGLRLKHTCEGSQIDVYVSSFDTTFTYHWTGPDFDATTSIGHIFIERDAPSGFYVVELGNTGCSATVKDSVELKVMKAPKIALSDSMIVCPGEELSITSTVEFGRGNVTYIIGKEENSVVSYYNFSGQTGAVSTIQHLAESEARFWVHQVKDDSCTFKHPEDTIAIRLRDMTTACDVTVSSPQVCYGAPATFTASAASPTMEPPYVVRWYADADQQNMLRVDSIKNPGEVSTFTTDPLLADSAFYVTIQDTVHCETHAGTVSSWCNMSSVPVVMSCGQNIRYFDAGGYNNPYSPGEDYRQTFSSNGNDRITISFNSFNTQENGGVMRIYSGSSVLQDSILAVYSGSSLPAAVTSHGNSLTVVFTSTEGTSNYYEGWDADVSCSALPAKAEVKVLDALAVTLTATPALPARYGQDITLTAQAVGGEGSQYQYQWFTSTDNQNWVPGRIVSSPNATDDTTLTNITTSQYVKVSVTDVSAYQCAGNPEETVFLEVVPIQLALQMNTEAREICQGDIPVILTVQNTGAEIANNVKVKMQLPDGMRLVDEADTLISMGNVPSNDNNSKIVYVHSEIHADTVTNAILKAQIWSCDQGDMSSNWHSWDWTELPAEPDEDSLLVKVRPSLDMTDPGTLTVTDAAICYGAGAHFEAHSNIQYPQYFTWYADEALTQELSRETVDGVNKTYSTYDVTNVTSFTPAYVSLRNDQYCPAYTSVDYLTKMDITPTDTILMQNGSYLIGNSDHIRFFDDGGPNGYYSPNRLYKFLFTSLDDSPITIYFDDTYQYIGRSNNEGKIEIFDGDNEMVPRYMYYDGNMRGKVVTTSTSGKMLVVFQSGDYSDVGISAHVFTTKRELVGEANVTFNAVMPVEEITTYNAQTCYGDTTTLRASTSSTSYPQYFTWYDANLTQVHQDTVETAGGKSDYTVPSVTGETSYYVTMGNADYCPVMVASNATTNERTVLLNAANNRKTTPVLPTDVIDFYDAGGPNNGYNSITYTHTFTGVQGKLKIEMNTYYMREYDTLYAYNGTTANESNLLAKWGRYSDSYGSIIESDSASVLFVLKGHGGCCYEGWHARITSQQSGAMAEAKATVKMGEPTSITTQDVALCYGSEANLWATSSLDVPQTFVWYGPDRTQELSREVITTPGDSSKLPVGLNPQDHYYVTVFNATTCPIPDNYSGVMDTDNLVKVNVSFLTPVIATNVTATGGEACNGQLVTLTAKTDNTNNQRYAWYDENFTLVQDTVGVESYLRVPATRSTVYYVNASEEGGCPLLPPYYDAILFDASITGGTTNLAEGEARYFFDEGGANQNYSTQTNSWVHIFKAPAGKQVTLQLKNFYTCCDGQLEIYDGTNTNYHRVTYKCNQYNDKSITSERGALTVRWRNYSNCSRFGWNALVGVKDATGHMRVNRNLLASANVNVMAPVSPDSITVTDVQVCYGSEATLTAHTSIAAPQTFVWYGPDRIEEVKRETVSNGESQMTCTPTEATTYYVAVTNEANCPIVQHVNGGYKEVLMGVDGNKVDLTSTDSVGFFDKGGKDGDYYSNCSGYSKYFYAPSGSNVHLHFSNVQLDSHNDGYLYIEYYDANSRWHSEYIYGSKTDLDFVSYYGNYIRVYFYEGCNGGSYPGWEGYVYAVSPKDPSQLTQVNVTFKDPVSQDSITVTDAQVCYGSEATFTATTLIAAPQTFVWYGPDRTEELKRETVSNGESHYTFTPTEATSYYVAVTNEANCPIIPHVNGEYKEVLMGDAGNRVNLTSTDSVGFFDMGGKNSTYTAECRSYEKYFYGPSGSNVHLHFNSVQLDSLNNGYLYVEYYDANYRWQSKYIYGSETDLDFVSHYGNYLRVYFSEGCSGGSYPGWEGYVYAVTPKDANQLAQVNVSFKDPVSPSAITVDNQQVCYGSEATLTATTSIASPQTFVWYGPDRMEELKRETVTNGESQLTVLPTEVTTYYVAVTNADNCPIVSHLSGNYCEVNMIPVSNSLRYTVMAGDSVGFFDAGGKDSTYTANCGGYSYYFYPPANGYNVRLHLSNVQLDENQNSYLEIQYVNAKGEWEYKTLRGNQTDLNFVSYRGNYLRVYFYEGCVGGTYPGWEGYLYAIKPKDENQLAHAEVSFRDPVFSNDVVVSDEERCYGYSVTLTAHTDATTVQNYAWYDQNLNLLKYETGVTSTLDTIVTENTFYYVNVSGLDGCPSMPPGYGEKIFDAHLNGTTTEFINVGDAVRFYDEGGINNDYYTPNVSWKHTFKAPLDKHVTIRFSSFDSEGNCDYLYIYDGQTTDNLVAELSGNIGVYSYTTSTDYLTLIWKTDGSVAHSGWEAMVGVLNDNGEMTVSQTEMTKVNVILKAPLAPSVVTTTDGEACYGQMASLTASAELSYPQYYRWYNPERTEVVKYDTITSGSSTLTVPVYGGETYYVYASCDTSCPVLDTERDHYVEINLGSTNGNTRTLSATDSVGFFDAGGKDGNYNANCRGYNYYFYPPTSDYTMRLHFNSVQLDDNESAYLQVQYVNIDGNWEYKTIRGTQSDLDFESYYGHYLYVYFYDGCNGGSYPGWEGYVYAVKPHDASELAEVHASVKAPIAPSVVTTTDGEACYGQMASMTASAELSYPQYYTWYNAERTTIVKRDTIQSGSSTYTVPAYGNDTCYVAVSCDTTCPVQEVVRDNYREETMPKETYNHYLTVSLNDSIGFFDNGGRDNDGSYSSWSSRNYYINAEEGASIRLHFNSLYLYSGYMYIYNENTGEQIAYFSGNYQSNNPVITDKDYVIPSNRVRVYLSYYYDRINWDAFIYAVKPHDASELAEVHSSIKPPLGPADVVTVDDKGCYGSPVTLVASTDVAVPQYYTWYDEDYNVVFRDTINAAGDSSHYHINQVTGTKHYYVAVSNADECPVVIPSPKTVLLNSTTTGQSTDVTLEHPVHFYDAGGPNESYREDGNTLTHTFNAPAGGQVYATFQNRFYLNSGDQLHVYDGTSDADPRIYTFTYSDNNSNMFRQFQSSNGSLTFKLERQYGCCREGWDAVISLTSPSNTEVRMQKGQNSTVLNSGETVKFYDEGGRDGGFCVYGDESSSNYPYTQTFTTANGIIQATFHDYMRISDATLSVYDGSDVDETKLIKRWQGNQELNGDVVLSSTGSSMTFKLHYDYNQTCPEGWRAEITTLPELAVATASVRVVEPSTITTTDAEVCYGSEATLTATSSIGYPQYYEWYSPDRMTILKYDTVTSGSSSFTMLPGAEETYYVTVTNDTTCPAVTAIHNNLKEVFMGVNEDRSAIRVNLQSSDSLKFYDAGGPDANMDCSHFNNSCWNQSLYVTAPEGSWIRVHLNYFNRGNKWPYMRIYDMSNGGSEIDISRTVNDKDYVIESNSIRLYFDNNCDRVSFPGWDGFIYAIAPRAADELAEAHVTFKTPVTQNTITADDVEVCYGSEATLTASSTLDYPQEFVWYDPDRMEILKRETITSGNSTLAVTPDEETTYYVAVTNADNCPIVETIHSRYREVSIRYNSRTINLLPADSVRFFDDGGKENNYDREIYSYTYFRTDDGGQIHIHFDTITLANRDARLTIRDNNENRAIANLRGPLSARDLDYVVESDNIEVYFRNESSSTAPGWEGYVYAIAPHNADELKEVSVRFSQPVLADNITVSSDEVCYGAMVTLTATTTATDPQRFVWYNERAELLKDEVATGTSTLNVVATAKENFYVNASAATGCPVLPPYNGIGGLSYGTVTLKAPLAATSITTRDEEVCYGSEATLSAKSSIDFPQSYVWYAPDRITVLKRETISSDSSTLSVVPTREETYYVAVTNADNCPIVDPIHNHLVVKQMSNRDNSYTLLPTDSVRFYDTGGKDGDYWTDWSSDYRFYADQGSYIRIHFDTVQLASGAYIQIYEGENGNNVVASISGSRSNVDYLIENNKARIYFNGYSNQTAPGWEAYVYAIPQRDMDQLAEASVTFTEPVINSSSIVTTDAVACYGENVILMAKSSLTGNLHYVWYDSDMNLLKQEMVAQGDSSTLSVPALGSALYYVNVSEEGACPVLPPNYGQILLNESNNNITTVLTTDGVGIPFYDEGGPNGNYVSTNADWYYTFKAPQGKHVTIKFNNIHLESCCGERIYLYNGTRDNHSYLWDYGCGSTNDRTFTSDDNLLTVRWYNYSGCTPRAGWDAVVGILDEYGNMTTNAVTLAEANVSMKSPTLGLPVITTNDTVCYGAGATLTAISPSEVVSYPQYFTWYAPDAHTMLLRDTVDGTLKTQSTLTAPYYYQYQNQTYYVTVSNPDNCPMMIKPAPGGKTYEMELNSITHDQTTVLTPSDKVTLYNDGGKNYNSSCGGDYDHTHTFTTTQGYLKVEIGDGDYFADEDTLYLYDSDHIDESRLIAKITREMVDRSPKYVTTGHSVTFHFEAEDGCRFWRAYIKPFNMQADFATANVTVNVTSVPASAITVHPDTVCMGGEAVVSASADLSYPQYYVWYNSQMEEVLRDTLQDASQTASVLHLPAQYVNASYYALIYSDTVSCLMLNNPLPKVYSELWLTRDMDDGETIISPNDSIGFFSDGRLLGENNNYLNFDYYFVADEGIIQIHFDTLVLNDADLELEDEGYEMYFAEYDDDTYYDLTITSLSSNLHLNFYIRSNSSSYAQWSGTVTNINAVNDTILSNMVEAGVHVHLNSSAATVITTNDTVCIGSPALLTASSTIGYPQYYTWYNEDMSQILFKDTISSGKSNYYIPGQVGNATFRVVAHNDTTCAVKTDIPHGNFREFLMNDANNGLEIFVGATDSVVIYDDGGKNGNYTVPDDWSINVLKFETYTGATLDIRIPVMEVSINDGGFVLIEPDANGNLNLDDIDENSNLFYTEQSLSGEYTYSSSGNVVFMVWALGDDSEPMKGFEVVATSNLHSEDQAAKANVLMKSTPPMTTNAISSATNAVICQNDDAVLEATSTLSDNPQYFVWYNSDLSSVLAVDTVPSGNLAQVAIPNLMQDTLLYVAVGTDDICPAYPMTSKIVSELRLNQSLNGDTTWLSLVDSVMLYDDGGPNGDCSSYGLTYRTFFAPEGQHVVIKFSQINFEDDDNFVAVGEVEGELDENDISMAYTGTEIDAGDSVYVSTGNYLTVVCYVDDLDWDEEHGGFAAAVYTTEALTSDMSVLTPAQVTVNPSYHFETVDTVEARTAPYSVGIFTNLNVSVAGDYTIDSVYHTAGTNCDSTYTLKLHVNPSSIVDTEDPTFTAPADTIICRLVANEMILHPDVAITGVPTDQADDMTDYATLVANTTYTDDAPTGTDDSIRYVLRHWRVDDGNGHVTEHVQRIGVFPAIHAGNTSFTTPAQIEITLAYGRCDTMLELGSATYATTVKQSPITITNDAPSGGRFPVGTFNVVWIATDTCGFVVTDTQTVTVNYPPCGTGHDVVYDHYTYHTVRVGCECWLQENLRNTSYADGTEVSKYGIYNNEQTNEEDFGLLYSWYSAVRVPEGDNLAVPADSTAPMGEKYFKGLCPDGWALPTSAQYDDLWLNGYGVDGIKDMDTHYWLPGHAGTLPNCGFNARGAGYYDNTTDQYYNLLGETYFWTGEVSTTIIKGRCSVITHNCPELIIQEQPKGRGQSVRCVQKR